MDIKIQKIREKKSRIGFMVRTRDRTELTQQTLPPLLTVNGIDVYWIDGSVEAEGLALANTAYRALPGLCEVHTGISIGLIRSFIYGIKQLIENEYEFIGLIDGDVLLQPGWFEAMCALYERGKKDGLHVGAVSARAIDDRILVPRDGYAVMANVGGGMVMLRREVFLEIMLDESDSILNNNSFLFSDMDKIFKEVTDLNYPMTQRMRQETERAKLPPGASLDWQLSTDWWWEVVMIKCGMVALATTPSLAANIDDVGAENIFVKEATVSDPRFDWQSFTKRLGIQYEAYQARITEPANNKHAVGD